MILAWMRVYLVVMMELLVRMRIVTLLFWVILALVHLVVLWLKQTERRTSSDDADVAHGTLPPEIRLLQRVMLMTLHGLGGHAKLGDSFEDLHAVQFLFDAQFGQDGLVHLNQRTAINIVFSKHVAVTSEPKTFKPRGHVVHSERMHHPGSASIFF